MKLSRVFAIVFATVLVTSSLLVISVPMVNADAVYKQVLGIVDPNSGTGVFAYDPVPADNGWTYFYIQNRTNEGTGTDPMTQLAGFDIYDPEIYINVSDWMIGDECINVVNREVGAYGVDHAGYVAFMNMTLSDLAGTDVAPTTELLKIPTPSIDVSGFGFINISWGALADPNGLIAGYTVYSSENNGTVSGDAEWTIAGGSVNAPITDLFFNHTGITEGTDYYYAIKVVFTGYTDNNPANVDNYECAYFGEGSELITAPSSGLTLDYILITDTPDGTELTTVTIPIGDMVTAYASGYNDTGTPIYIGLIEVDWTGAGGSWAPGLGTSSTYTAGMTGGLNTQTGANATLVVSDTFDIDILQATVDYIVLEYLNGTEIPDMELNMSMGSLDIYAVGYNNTGPTSVGNVIVAWENITIDNGTGIFSTSSGDTTTYTGTTPGFVEIKGTYMSTLTDNFTLKLVWGIPPTVDLIKIMDAAGAVEITTVTLDILKQTQLFAWGFNQSTMIGQVDVGWERNVGGTGTINIATGLSTNYTAGTVGDVVRVYANITIGSNDLTDYVEITVNAPTVDYIKITDIGDGLELVSELISTVGSVDAYASGYNNTADTYVGLVVVTWTNDEPTLGDLNPTTPADMVTFQGADGDVGTVLITATYSPGITDNFTIELMTFTLDTIEITDAPNGNFTATTDLDVGAEITLYASGYNDTGGYVGLQDVDWTQAPNTIGTFSAATGSSTVFTAGMATDQIYTTTITGANSGLGVTDNFVMNINPPTPDSIQIRDAADGQGNEVTTDEFTLGGDVTTTYYCAGYNDTALYIGDVTADWTLDNAIGGVNPAAGTSTLFTATTAGSGILTASVSGLTDTITITVIAAVDDIAPAIPIGLTVAAGTTEGSLVLTWTANTETDLAGYNVYKSNSATGTFTKVNTALLTDTTYTDSSLAAGTYYYKITAQDNTPNESNQTAAVSGEIQAPPDDVDGEDKDDEFPIVLLLLPIIIIIVLLLMFLMMKKKKPEEAAPPEEEKKELPPPPGAAVAEEVEVAEEEEELPPPEDEEAETTEEEGDTDSPDDEEESPEEEASKEE
jgi:hypothetical protein